MGAREACLLTRETRDFAVASERFIAEAAASATSRGRRLHAA